MLATVTVGTLVLYGMFPEHSVIQDFGPELSTNAAAILVTLVFVQRLLNRQEWRRRLRGSIGGLRHASRQLTRMQAAWATILKGTLPAVPVERRDSTWGLFTDARTEELIHLDPLAPLQPGQTPALAWLAAELLSARDALRTIARQYATGFDAEYIEAFEELLDDPFIELVAELARKQATARDWRLRINSARGARAHHFAQLLLVLELHNDIAAEAARLRSTRPRTHELGLDRAADHDLRVETTLSTRWWAEQPHPGVLREVRHPPTDPARQGDRWEA